METRLVFQSSLIHENVPHFDSLIFLNTSLRNLEWQLLHSHSANPSPSPFEARNGERVYFITRGWTIFKVSLHKWQWGANPPILVTQLFQILSNPLPPALSCHLQPPPSIFFLLSSFFGWMSDHTTFDVVFGFQLKFNLKYSNFVIKEH